MRAEDSGESRARRRSLRVRLIALVIGTGVVPFALALLLLLPVFHRKVAQAQGATLAREAAFLAAQVDVYLRAHHDDTEARRVVEAFRRGRLGRAYLYDSAGGRLAGLPDLPAMPSDVGRPGPGWTTFEFGRVSYFAGVAVLPGRSSASGPSGGLWYLAIVQPKSEVMGPVWDAFRRTALFFGGVAGLALFFSWRLAEAFFVPLRKLRQGAEIVARINLAHRIDIGTGDELEGMAHEFNRMAESLQSAYGPLEEQVRGATSHLSEERNRLAAVLRTMTEGVVLTNEAGAVALMTPRARLALGAGASSCIGVPLTQLLPAERLDFHLRRIRRAWGGAREPAEVVVFPFADGRVVRGVLSAVPGPASELAGFLFVFRDLRARADRGEGGGELLREIPHLLKGPAATLQSLVGVLETRPDMAEPRRLSFVGAMAEEVTRLAERLETAEAAASVADSLRWPVSAADPADLLTEAVGDTAGVRLSIDLAAEEPSWVLVEPYSWVKALSTVLRRIRSENPGVPVEVSLSLEEEAVVVTLRVRGAAAPDPSALEEEPVKAVGEEVVSLGALVRRNRGEMWTRATPEGFEVRLALIRASKAAERAAGVADDQPEFYNFDLFLPHLEDEPAELLRTPLAELEFVVFDTETTGMDPSGGDEIVSVSAVRVRRGKVVAADTFHTLVNPRRHIPKRSTRFHGIVDAMVGEAPTLEQVLPQFGAYLGSAVLVAHNAAFDKRFLDLAAGKYGLPAIENPLLDTLLLSYGLHKDFEGHNLDAIARRLGVEIKGRHTSLGDARATAEVFLGLVPLLSARGVVTLGDAKAFCDKMLLLRWQTSRY